MLYSLHRCSKGRKSGDGRARGSCHSHVEHFSGSQRVTTPVKLLTFMNIVM